MWGVAFANIVRGVPLNAAHVYTGNLLTLLNPYGLLGGLVTLSLFTLHGAIFLSLKTTGELRERARRAARGRGGRRAGRGRVPRGHPVQPRQARHRRHRRAGRGGADRRAVAALRGREGWAFAGTAVTLALAVATLFGDLWPDVLPSTTARPTA